MSLATGVYNFGAGYLFTRRTDITTPTPTQFGVLQDVSITFDRTLKELTGQLQFPVDVAVGAGKITCSAKHAEFDINMFNSLFFGNTLTSGAGTQVTANESHAIPTTPYQVTIAPPSSGTFVQDLGVRYATGGQLLRVASGPVTGQYSVAEPSGVYTFAAADTTLTVLISYSYTVTTATMNEIVITNQLMGVGPTFEAFLQLGYPNNVGTVNPFNLKLNACRSSKLGFPLKNTDYTIPDFEWQAFADSSGNIGILSQI
jgi:hypothetical protein